MLRMSILCWIMVGALLGCGSDRAAKLERRGGNPSDPSKPRPKPDDPKALEAQIEAMVRIGLGSLIEAHQQASYALWLKFPDSSQSCPFSDFDINNPQTEGSKLIEEVEWECHSSGRIGRDNIVAHLDPRSSLGEAIRQAKVTQAFSESSRDAEIQFRFGSQLLRLPFAQKFFARHQQSQLFALQFSQNWRVMDRDNDSVSWQISARGQFDRQTRQWKSLNMIVHRRFTGSAGTTGIKTLNLETQGPGLDTNECGIPKGKLAMEFQQSGQEKPLKLNLDTDFSQHQFNERKMSWAGCQAGSAWVNNILPILPNRL